MRRRYGQRGSAAIEMAILMPLFVALFTTAVVIGRTANAMSAVEAAAYDGARTASLARNGAEAQTRAMNTVEESLGNLGLECVGGPDVVVNTTEFALPLGEPANVYVTVSCTVTYADVDVLGVPTDQTVTAEFVSPIDQYRARQ